MSKLTSLEVIQKLSKPECKDAFENEAGTKICRCLSGIVWLKSGMFVTLDDQFFNLTWQKVRKPVNFMEAAKAYVEGKTIECERKGLGANVYSSPVSGLLLDQNEDAISTDEIFNGTWYIKEESE